MKKQYITPEMIVFKVDTSDIICTSAGVQMMNEEEANGDEGLAKEFNERSSIWDYEW